MGTTYFKGTTKIGQSSITELIEDNLISYIDWCFLELGAFFNVTIPSSGAYGGNRERLRNVNDPRYSNGQVWESYRQNWVWQSGLKQINEQPISISGIYVNSSFLPRGSGYSINYKNGQIVFDNPIPTNSVVRLEYSHKWIDVVGANDVPWFKSGHTNSFRVDDSAFLANSGIWNELADTRLQLPVVAVEVVDKSYAGYQLGGGQWSNNQVILHILAENSQTAKRISSILSEQNESTIFAFDPDMIAENNRYPLDYNGDLNDNPLCYPDLVAYSGDGGFRTDRIQHGKMRIYGAHGQNHGGVTTSVYHSTVRYIVETILPKI
jgi:hypothetical protein